MEFLDLLKKRYSVRSFESKSVEKEKLSMILEAGRLAPTACNNQPQRILVLDSEDNLEKIKRCTPYTFHAPLILIICYDQKISWKRKSDNEDMGGVDAAIVTTHMMLEAANLGLGSTWVGQFDSDKIKTIFSLPLSYVPVAILPIGYPDRLSTPHPNHNKRLDIEETVSVNSLSK